MSDPKKRFSTFAARTPPSAISIPTGSSPGDRRSALMGGGGGGVGDGFSTLSSPTGSFRRSSSGGASSFVSLASSPAFWAPSSPMDSPSSSPSPHSPLNTSTTSLLDFDTGFGDGYMDPTYSKTATFVSGVRVKAPAEFGRSDHTSVVHNDLMYIYGGVVGEPPLLTPDFHVYNFVAKEFSMIVPAEGALQPRPRYQHAAVVHNGEMFIFGGSADEWGLLGDMFSFSFETQTWSEITPATDVRPSPRRGHSAVVVNGNLYIFGGFSDSGGALSDMYKFDFESRTWSVVTPSNGIPPSPRFLHTAVVHENSIWIFGGTDGTEIMGDLLEYNIESTQWEEVQCEPPSPYPRCNHASAVFQNSMFVLGGDTETDQIDVYEFDIPARKWYRILPTTPGIIRSGHSVVVRGESVYVFGGADDKGPYASSLDALVLGQKEDFEEELQESAQDEEITRQLALPRQVWEAVLLKKHPEILQYRELTRELTGVKTYSRARQVGTTEDPSHLPHQSVLNLIVEHLNSLGLSRSATAIVEESKVPYFPITAQPDSSRLSMILKVLKSRAKTKNIFDSEFALNSSRSYADAVDPEVELVDHLPGAGRTELQQDGEEDTDIWDEKEDSRKNIVRGKDENNKPTIRAANLNKLVQALTMDREKTPDAVYLKTFFYTYHSFASPEAVLSKLIQKYNVPIPKGGADERYMTEVVEPVHNRVCKSLKFWIEQCPWDFNGPSAEKLLNNLNAFIDGPLTRDGQSPDKNTAKVHEQLIKQLRNSINKSLKKKTVNEDEKTITVGYNPPEPKVPRNIFSPHLQLKDVDEVEIARQLTLIEFGTFANIAPIEFLNKWWEDPNPKRSPHLKEMIARAIDLTRWVALTILKNDNKKGRAKLLEKWIKVADQLRSLKNFQTMYSVVAGFNHPTITRLGQLFGEISQRAKEIYNDLVMFVKDDKQYHDIMRGVPLPCIPSIDVTLADLTTAQDVPDNINNLINFQKRQQMYQHITTFQIYQQRQFNLLPVHQIASLLNKIPKINEKELDELSRKTE